MVCNDLGGCNGSVIIYLTVRVVRNGVVMCSSELVLVRVRTFEVMNVTMYMKLKIVVIYVPMNYDLSRGRLLAVVGRRHVCLGAYWGSLC